MQVVILFPFYCVLLWWFNLFRDFYPQAVLPKVSNLRELRFWPANEIVAAICTSTDLCIRERTSFFFLFLE